MGNKLVMSCAEHLSAGVSDTSVALSGRALFSMNRMSVSIEPW